eukprot:c27005_g1_i1 orf=41-286(-)
MLHKHCLKVCTIGMTSLVLVLTNHLQSMSPQSSRSMRNYSGPTPRSRNVRASPQCPKQVPTDPVYEPRPHVQLPTNIIGSI